MAKYQTARLGSNMTHGLVSIWIHTILHGKSKRYEEEDSGENPCLTLILNWFRPDRTLATCHAT